MGTDDLLSNIIAKSREIEQLTTEISQVAYGHPARKRTWLYAMVPVPPPLRWAEDRRGDARITWARRGNDDRPILEDDGASSATPPDFRDVLLAMARNRHLTIIGLCALMRIEDVLTDMLDYCEAFQNLTDQLRRDLRKRSASTHSPLAKDPTQASNVPGIECEVSWSINREVLLVRPNPGQQDRLRAQVQPNDWHHVRITIEPADN